jgi:nicotinamide mononucleotide adenylyltransferase
MSEIKTSAEYSAVAATLGLKDDFQPRDVMARLSELLATETKFKQKEKELSDAQTVIAGRDATIKNLQKELGEATASLSAFQKKEKDEKTARIEAMIEAAITAGKIDRESKTDWAAMAEANLSLAENTLASIPAREQISKEIAGDPANVKAAAEAAKSAGDKMAEKVSEVVGEKFAFKKLD